MFRKMLFRRFQICQHRHSLKCFTQYYSSYSYFTQTTKTIYHPKGTSIFDCKWVFWSISWQTHPFLRYFWLDCGRKSQTESTDITMDPWPTSVKYYRNVSRHFVLHIHAVLYINREPTEERVKHSFAEKQAKRILHNTGNQKSPPKSNREWLDQYQAWNGLQLHHLVERVTTESCFGCFGASAVRRRATDVVRRRQTHILWMYHHE